MKRILAAAAVLLALGGSAVAQQRGYVTTDVNLRAGPGTAYPVVVILEGGTPLGIYGCIDDYSWCDVDWRGNRGWIAARYLGYDYRGRRVDFYDYAPTIGVPIVAFSFDDYWGRYYRGRSWYSNYDRWGPPPPRGYRPPPYGGPGYGPGYGPPPPGWNGGGRPPPPPPGGNWGGPPPGGGWNGGGRPPPPPPGGNWGGPPPGGGWNGGGRPPQGGNWGAPPPGGGWNNGGNNGRPPPGPPPQQGQRPPPAPPPQQGQLPPQMQTPGLSPQMSREQRCAMQPKLPGCPGAGGQ